MPQPENDNDDDNDCDILDDNEEPSENLAINDTNCDVGNEEVPEECYIDEDNIENDCVMAENSDSMGRRTHKNQILVPGAGLRYKSTVVNMFIRDPKLASDRLKRVRQRNYAGKRVQVDQDSQSVLCKFDDIAVYIAKEKMVRILRAERFIKQGKRSKIEYYNPVDLSSEVQNITLIGSPFSPSINTTANFSEGIVLTMKRDITEAPLAKYIVKVKLEYNTEDKNYILKQEEGKIIQQFLNRLSNLSTSARCIPLGIPHRDTQCMIKIFRGGRGGDTFKTPSPPTNNFCLYPPPVLRRLWKDPLMTPHPPTTPLQASFTATPLPIHHPFPPKNFDPTPTNLLMTVVAVLL